MSSLAYIVIGGVLMTGIAAVGMVTLVLKPATLDRLLLTLVAFAAGSLIGGAFFHMLPAAVAAIGDVFQVGVAVVAGFASFFLLEQLLHWHHCHRAGSDCRKPLTYLVLLGDGLHNFLGGLAVAGAFVIDIRLGVTAWLAAAAHEVPQELGDFAVLLHGGWSKRAAIAYNLLSGSAFLVGGLVTWALSSRMDVSWLIPIAAGNFLYIGAADLVPEVNKHGSLGANLVHFTAFLAGLGLLFATGWVANS